MPFLGMRGTGDWVANEVPEDWREAILYLYPNGDAPLTAILSKIDSEETESDTFHWWTQALSRWGGSFTAGELYTDALLSSVYTSGGVQGDTVYIKLAEAVADMFRVGHQALIRDASDLDVDVNGKVTAVVKAGAVSYVAVKLLEADNNSSNGDLSDADTVLVIGNINAQGAFTPDSISLDPVEFSNFTQIFRDPLSLTRTARKTRYRTGDKYRKMKREALEMHAVNMEKAFFWGVKSSSTGSNNKPEKTMDGIVRMIRTNASGNVSNWKLDADFGGQTWLQGGESWLNTQLETIFRNGGSEKIAFCGSGFLKAINDLALNGAHINITPESVSYGIKVRQWLTPYGTLFLKLHPLFSHETTNRSSAVIVEPRLLTFRYIDDTMFFGEENMMKNNRSSAGSGKRMDGTEEEYLTEAGLEYHHPEAFGYLFGVGVTNTA